MNFFDLRENIALEFISRVTGLSIKKIEKIGNC